MWILGDTHRWRETEARAEEGWDSSLYASEHSDVSMVVVRIFTPLPSRVNTPEHLYILRLWGPHQREKIMRLMKNMFEPYMYGLIVNSLYSIWLRRGPPVKGYETQC